MKRGRSNWLHWTAALAAGAWLSGCQTVVTVDPTQAYVDAKVTLERAAEDPEAVTRVHAMEAIAQVLGQEYGGLLKQGLRDPHPLVRFAAAMAVGEVTYAPALPRLLEMAARYTGDNDRRVYCGVLYALYRLGNTDHLSDLADLLRDGQPMVRAVAAQVMGRIGNASAISLLRSVLRDEQKEMVKYNMIEAIALLGDAAYQEKLEAYATSFYLDLQLEAIPAMAREYSPHTMEVLQDLLGERYPPRARVKAAGVMARLGQVTAHTYALCTVAARTPDRFVDQQSFGDQVAAGMELASLQQLAAISLGWTQRREAVNTLYPLLQSPEGAVRVAAAMSILRLSAVGEMRRGDLADARPAAPAPSPRTPEGAAAPGPGEGTPVPAPPPRLRTAGAKD